MMRRLPNFWRCIDERTDTGSPLERWRRAAQGDFDVLERFLVPDGEAVSPVYPCPGCGRDLVVVPLGDAIVAEPDEGDTCRPIEGLTFEDVRAYALNWSAVFREISAATNIPLEIETGSGESVCARGALTRGFRRVVVAVRFGCRDQAISDEALRLVVAREGALLLTGQHRGTYADLLAGTSCGYAALEDAVGAGPDGQLVCGCDIGERLGLAPVCREGCLSIDSGPLVVGRGDAEAVRSETFHATGHHSESGGDIEDVDPAPGWTFEDEGATYRVVVPEGEFTMSKIAGARYLYWFAKNPRLDFSALRIVAEVNGGGVRKSTGDYIGDGDDYRRDPSGQAVDEVTTRESLQILRRDLIGVKTDRDRAENQGDVTRARELNDEIEGIKLQIKKDTGLGGRIRKTANDEIKTAGAIRRAINRCYADLRKVKHCPARSTFVGHFQQHLSFGAVCRYRVQPERDWTNLKKNIR